MPKSAYTGSQKKTFRGGNRVGRKSLKEIERSLKPGENLKQYGKSYKLAKEMLAPQAQEERRQFQQEEAPELIANLGVGAGAKSSSALNQALSASLTNLNHRMTSQTQNLAAQLADSDMNRRMQGAQFGAQIGQQNLNASPYLPSSGQPGFGKQLLGHGINIAAGVAGTMAGGPGGGMAASTLSQQLTKKLTGGGNQPTTSIGSGGDSSATWSADQQAQLTKGMWK